MVSAAFRPDYWKTVWAARHFLFSLVQLDLRNRYRRSVLGVGWSLLNPLLMTLTLAVVFHDSLNVRVWDHIPFVLAGIGIWNFLSGAIGQGCQCFCEGEKYLRCQPLPLAVYPLRTVLGLGFHFLVTFFLALLATLVLKGLPHPTVLWGVLPGVALLFVFSCSLVVLFGVLNVYFPDTHQIASVLLQALFFLSPVFYPSSSVRHPLLCAALRANPLAAFLNLVREPAVFGRLPPVQDVGAACLATLVSSCLALYVLSCQEKKLIFHF